MIPRVIHSDGLHTSPSIGGGFLAQFAGWPNDGSL
jgi:hypothetical protein